MAPCPDCLAVNAPGTLFCVACSKPLGLALPGLAPVIAGGGLPSAGEPSPAAGSIAALAAARPQPLALASRSVRLIALENLQPTGLALMLPDTGYQGTLLVGRTDLANGTVVDLDLAPHGGRERRVSRRHARLRYAQGLIYVADWESAHGTWLNKQKLATGEECPLAEGDEVRFADFVWRVEMR
jgi:hypothetical protein